MVSTIVSRVITDIFYENDSKMDSNSQEVVVPTYKQQNWGSYTLFYHNVYKTE